MSPWHFWDSWSDDGSKWNTWVSDHANLRSTFEHIGVMIAVRKAHLPQLLDSNPATHQSCQHSLHQSKRHSSKSYLPYWRLPGHHQSFPYLGAGPQSLTSTPSRSPRWDKSTWCGQKCHNSNRKGPSSAEAQSPTVISIHSSGMATAFPQPQIPQEDLRTTDAVSPLLGGSPWTTLVLGIIVLTNEFCSMCARCDMCAWCERWSASTG